MKIVTWNVNGIRSFDDKWKHTICSLDADIICVQETKVTRKIKIYQTNEKHFTTFNVCQSFNFNFLGDMLDEPTALIDGYTSYFAFSRKKSGYSGVATYCNSKYLPVNAEEGLGGTFTVSKSNDDDTVVGHVQNISFEFTHEEVKALDAEGRCVITVHRVNILDEEKKLAVFNLYCPRADPEKPERLTYKLQFYKLLEIRVDNLRKAGYLVIIVGDINTSHHKIDHCDPYEVLIYYLCIYYILLNKYILIILTIKSIGLKFSFLQEFYENPSRQWMSHFLQQSEENAEVSKLETKKCKEADDLSEDWKISRLETCTINGHQFIDSFRLIHPNRKEAFTCWNTEMKCRENNYGTRIDYIFTDVNLIPYLSKCEIQPEIMGSDHCPVRAEYDCIVSAIHNLSKPPTMCTKNFPEFAGNQQKLSAYFSSKIPNEKRKLDENIDYCLQTSKKKKMASSSTQSSISNFFSKKSTNSTTSIKNMAEEVTSSSTSSQKSPNFNFAPAALMDPPQLFANEEKRLKAATAWKAMMKGPPPAPLCKGHNELCVLRTVKKKGPNLGRQFWCCSRGEGRANDPNARCDFFKWIK